MSPEAAFTLIIVACVFVTLMATRIAPELILVGGLGLLLVTGVIDTPQALVGFSNEGMITIALLFVVSAGIKETGAIGWIADRILGRPRTLTGGLVRLMFPTALISAFINNTPLVAMMIPAVRDWARQEHKPPSKLMIPLSYAAILGGTCTIIGTSTNLVVNGLLIEAADAQAAGGAAVTLPRGFGLFDIAWVGIPCALAGIGFLLIAQRWLLPVRNESGSIGADPRQYTVEMIVEPGGPLVGKTIAEAGLRHLAGVYLTDIHRDGMLMESSPDFVLQANDHLIFAGNINLIRDLQKTRGLLPSTHQVFRLDAPRSQRCLIEAVVSAECPLVKERVTIRDGRFRSRYNAVILAAARGGERIEAKIGDVVLQPGDTLLLEAHPSFYEKHRDSKHFYFVSRVQDSKPPRFERAALAVVILLAMVLLVTLSQTVGRMGVVIGSWQFELGRITMFKGAVVAAGLMIVTRCCTVSEARRNVDWRVLLTIAAAFGIGKALAVTGAAGSIAHFVTDATASNPWLALAALYVATALMTETVTNNAAAALMFPFALAISGDLGVNPIPFVVAVMIAASAAFATPLGYQTNLMVYGPGNYRFTDYLRAGVPMDLLVMTVTLLVVPRVWPF